MLLLDEWHTAGLASNSPSSIYFRKHNNIDNGDGNCNENRCTISVIVNVSEMALRVLSYLACDWLAKVILNVNHGII